MTYYRNNVMHIFALPALLASFSRAAHASAASRSSVSPRRCTPICVPSCSCAGRSRSWKRWSISGWRPSSSGPAQGGRQPLRARRRVRGSSGLPHPAGAGGSADPATFLHGHLAAAQQRPAQPERRGTGEPLHGHGPTPVDSPRAQRAGVLRQGAVPPFHPEHAGTRRGQPRRKRPTRLSRKARGTAPRARPSACYRRRFACRSVRSRWSVITTKAIHRRLQPTPDAARSSPAPWPVCASSCSPATRKPWRR